MKKLLFLILIYPSLSRSQVAGDNVFNAPFIHEVYLTFSQPAYWDSLTANYQVDQYMLASMQIDSIQLDSIAVKFKGNSSYNNPSDKKPFKIDLNEYVAGQDVDGLKKFNLNNNFKDPSFLREKLTCDFYFSHGLNAPRCTFAKLFINGVYWGLYNLVEEVDTKQFLNARFGNNEGNMFKGDPKGDLRWFGNIDSLYYSKYELHTNETANDWSDLVNLIDKINNSGNYFYDSVETVLNTTSFIEQWAALNLFVNLDAYIGSGHNYFIYHDTLSNKFEWVAWDVNESFGNFNMMMNTTQLKNLSMGFVSTPASSRPLVQKMLANTTYYSSFENTICQWLQNDFSNATMDPVIDSLANVIRPSVYADTKKFFTNQDFDNNLSSDIVLTGSPPSGGTYIGLKSFITARRNSLISQLSSVCTTGILTGEKTLISVFPVPSSDFIFINSPDIIEYIKLTDVNGRVVREIKTNSPHQKIDISSFRSGMYFLQVNDAVFKIERE